MRSVSGCSVLAAVLLVILPAIQAQILPGIGLYAQLHKYEVYPPNQTAYGTPRRFRAMIANIATSNSTALQKLNGTVSFQDGLGQALCNASIVNNQTAFKSQLSPKEVDPTLATGALNNIIADNNLTAQFGSLQSASLADNATQAQLNQTLGPLQLYPLRIGGGAMAICNESFLTPRQYYALDVAYSNVTLNGSAVGDGVLPVANPKLNLNDYAFNIVKADTHIGTSGTAPNVTKIGSNFTVGALVKNASPTSIAYPDGGNVTVVLAATNKTVGMAPMPPQQSHRRKLLQTDLSSLFNIPVTIPSGTPSGLQQLLLFFTGNGNFNPSATPVGQGYFINVPGALPVAITGTANPATAAAGSADTISGTVSDPSGQGVPTGVVTLALNGQNYGPFQLTQSGASQSSYSGVVTAPAQTGNYQVGVSYLSDVGNYDQTSPYNVPLGVTPASTTVTQTLTPGASGSSSSGSSQAANSGTGTQVTVAGTVQGSNGETPSGTIQTTVTGNGFNQTYSTPITGGTYRQVISAPGAPGSYSVVSRFVPGPNSSLSPGTSNPTELSTSPAQAVITGITITPNPGQPGQPVTVSGAVTSPNGPLGGFVQLYLNGQPVGQPVPVGPDGRFTTQIMAPSADGQYPLRIDYIPPGATTPGASTTDTLNVGTGSGVGPNGFTIALGDGSSGFSFPNCLGSKTVTVTSSNNPAPTGDVALSIIGGMFGDKGGTLGNATITGNAATFTITSAKLKALVATQLIAKLQGLKNKSAEDVKAGLGDLRDSDILSKPGVLTLLPGQYNMSAAYGGDANSAAALVTAPYIVDGLCLVQALLLGP